MKQIPLTKGKVALVDDGDYEELSKHKWHCTSNGYAARRVFDVPYGRIVLMHREILAAPSDLHVDHRDGDHLNNQRENLRLATRSQNQSNRPCDRDNRAGYKGVSFCRPMKKYRARISVSGREVTIGYFDDPVEAARAYDAMARELHGSFARCNFDYLTAAEVIG
jgi:hypothetical protein